MMEKFFCYTHPNMHYMVYGDNDGECLLKVEKSDCAGGYFLPLNEYGNLYSTYIVEYIKDGVLYSAVANSADNCFKVEFAGKETSFGTFNSKTHKYIGDCIHPDFKYGLIEVGIKFLEHLYEKDGILIIGCSSNFCYKLNEKIDLNVDSIFLSGGIGDIFAIDSFLNDKVKNNIKTVYYGTKQALIIQKLLEAVPEYNVKQHVVVWNDFSIVSSFKNKVECGSTNEAFLQSADFGITIIFPQISSGYLDYNKSSWLDHILCEVNVNLPDNYIVICPYSRNRTHFNRNFSNDDWRETILFLEKRNIKGVVLNGEKDPIPNHPSLIDYSGQTSILESIEILKKGKYYIGIDSSFGVMAAKLMPADHIVIKMISLHGTSWKKIYWSPQSEFSFLKNKIDTSLLSLK